MRNPATQSSFSGIQPCLLLLVLLLVTAVATAQPTAPAPAPGAMPLFFEKPYLHTDRETYTAGDNIWFKAYLVNARSNHFIHTSKNLYVELLSPYSEIISRMTIRLDKGTGAGDFQLGDSIPSGTYRLRAYTNWMRNFGDSFVFEKDLTLHTLHKTTAEAMAMVSAAPGKSSLEMSATNPYVRVEPEVQIRFFPEGGALVNGVAGVVAFKAEDASGAGVPVKGSIYTSAGDTLSRFESTTLGMGSFVLLPVAGLTYYVAGKFKNAKAFRATLPAALAKGLALHVAHADSASLLVTVSASPASLQELQGKELLLVGRHGNVREVTVPFFLQDAQTSVRISNTLFTPGIAALTLYDDQLRPHCERLVYVPHRLTTALDISPDYATYKPNSRVMVKVKATAADGSPIKANLSVAAVDAGVLASNTTDIESYLLLQSELRGKIQQPGQYFDRQNKNRYKQLDLLLLTQGWRDFVWKKLSDTTHTIKYLPEQGFTVSGSVRQMFVDKPLPDANITLTAFRAKGQKIHAGRTDARGRYYFDGLQIYGKQTITVNAVNNKGKKAGILLVDSLLAEPLPVRHVPLLLLPEPVGFATTRDELMRRRTTLRKYTLSDTILLREFEIKSAKVTRMRDGTAALNSGLKDRVYTITKNDHRFETLRRFIDFHIPEDRIKEGNVQFFVNNWEIPINDNLSTEEVQDMESGVDTRSQHFRETVYSLSMQKVKKLILRQSVNMQGQTFFILYIDTAADAFDKVEFNRAIAGVHGYYESRVFYSPYQRAAGLPDERITLFWKDTILTDENGEATITFSNADPATKIRIVAEGITETGVPVVGTAVYDVK